MMINSTLCYVTRGNDVLMLHRVKKKNDINKDKWIGIGGKFENNESPDECLLRDADLLAVPRHCHISDRNGLRRIYVPVHSRRLRR